MKNETYNGWTNYATWKIHIEIFERRKNVLDFEDVEELDAEYCKDFAEMHIYPGGYNGSLAHSYCEAFLAQVNFYEIADSINQQIKESQFLRTYNKKENQ